VNGELSMVNKGILVQPLSYYEYPPVICKAQFTIDH